MTWCYALCQHPMYMIIDQDETAAERTPPWGAPDIETYIERIRRNLAALDQYPFLNFNYDFSGVELEDLAGRAPDLIERFKSYIRAGRVSFVNGSYAQPHLHTLGSESNLRQMTKGLATIERLVGVRVDTYAHQEPGIHDQMPQLLRALGYRFAVTPAFFWTISFLTPHEILGVQYQGLRFLQDEEFTDWAALDGTTIPLYLSQPRLRPAGSVHGSDSHQRSLRAEFIKDLLHYPPIRCDFPDMVEVDEDWLADHAGQEYVILNEALQARLGQTPVRSRARLYTYWGYGDGLEAERLHRADRCGERALLEAEALNALAAALANRPAANLDQAWRRLLRAQHHDAYWVAGVGLREKAIGWVHEARVAADQAFDEAGEAILARAHTLPAAGGRPLVVWEPWPVARTDVATITLEAPAGTTTYLSTLEGESIPAQVVTLGGEEGSRSRLLALVSTDGLGYQVLEARPAPTGEEQPGGSLSYENDFYRLALNPDGTVAALSAGGQDLIGDRGPGNVLKASSEDGAPLSFTPIAPPEISFGPVAQVVRITGRVGTAGVRQTMLLYHHLPRLDFTLAFDFDDTLFGNYWQDESKLNLYWPVVPGGRIDHDIPFGVVAGREERPFFAASWVRLGSDRAGLALFHRGTNRFWVRDNVLANMLACGVMGREIGTRAWPDPYIKDYDLRLNGRQVIHYALYPHTGNWTEANVPAQAFSYQYPLRGAETTAHPGTLPARLSLARLETETLRPTAFFATDDGLTCRLFETMGRAARPALACRPPWILAGVSTLAGASVETIEPFTVAELTVRKAQPNG